MQTSLATPEREKRQHENDATEDEPPVKLPKTSDSPEYVQI